MLLNSSAIEAQIEIEELTNRNQLIPRLREVIEESEAHKDFDIDKNFLVDLWVFLNIHKRTDASTLIGLLKRRGDNLQQVADMLVEARDQGACEYCPETGKFISIYNISSEIQDELDRYMYPLPLLVPPKEVTHNRQTGYFTKEASNMSILLKKSHHSKDVCLDVINIQNAIPLYVSMEVANKAPALFKSLKTRKPSETRTDYDKRMRQFHVFHTTTMGILEEFSNLTETIYLTHAYDKRGRLYPRGYHVNYQGHDWAKSIIHLEPELISLEPC